MYWKLKRDALLWREEKLKRERMELAAIVEARALHSNSRSRTARRTSCKRTPQPAQQQLQADTPASKQKKRNSKKEPKEQAQKKIKMEIKEEPIDYDYEAPANQPEGSKLVLRLRKPVKEYMDMFQGIDGAWQQYKSADKRP